MATTNAIPARRGSLVGPLMLLLLGVVFLISNLRPDLSAWRMFAHYWPYLLIFWGVARIVEYAVARMSSRPIARAMSGGEIFLVILVCLLGSGFSAADRGDWRFGRLTHRGLEVLGENFEFPVQGSHAVPANATVVVSNLQGNVRVVGIDTTEMKISGRKSIKAFDRASADAGDQATPLEITQQGDQIVIRSNQEKLSGDRRISTDLEITVPKSVAVNVDGRLGDFDLKDVAGPVVIQSNSGGVRLTNIAKSVRVSSRRSDIVQGRQLKSDVSISGGGRDIELEEVLGNVSIDGSFSGNIKLQNIAKPVRYTSSRTELAFEKLPGKMEMDLRSLLVTDVVGPFRLTSQNKDVRLEDFAKEVEISARNGDVELRTSKIPLGNIQAETTSGHIELELPANARFNLQATTENGKAENEYGESVRIEKRGNSAEMRSGTPGSGAQIRLSSRRGNIVVRKVSQSEKF